MSWDIEFTDEFEAWWDTLSVGEQDAVTVSVNLLRKHGPQLKFPYSSGVFGSRHDHMRELRTQYAGHPLRTLYAFDPRRTAILLIGGDKTGNNRWYETYAPTADRLYDDYIEQLKKENLIDG
jgi:hypothetical protein